MNAPKSIPLLAVLLALAGLSSCEFLAAGLGDARRAALAEAVGRPSLAATWTYLADPSQNIGLLNGSLRIAFSQAVDCATDEAGLRRDAVELTVSFTQDGYRFEKTLSLAAAGELSSDGLSYAVPLAQAFAATQTGIAGHDGLSDDGRMQMKALVKGFVSRLERDPLGAPRPIPVLSQNVKLQPLVDAWPSALGVTSANGIDGATVKIPVNLGLSVADFSLSDNFATHLEKANIASIAMDGEGKNLVVSFKDPAGSFRAQSGDLNLTLLDLRAADYASTGQYLASKTLGIKFSPFPISMLKWNGAALPLSALSRFQTIQGGCERSGLAKIDLTVNGLPDNAALSVAGGKQLYAAGGDFGGGGLNWSNDPDNYGQPGLKQTPVGNSVRFVFYYLPTSTVSEYGSPDVAGAELAFKLIEGDGSWTDRLSGANGNIWVANVGAGNSAEIVVDLP